MIFELSKEENGKKFLVGHSIRKYGLFNLFKAKINFFRIDREQGGHYIKFIPEDKVNKDNKNLMQIIAPFAKMMILAKGAPNENLANIVALRGCSVFTDEGKQYMTELCKKEGFICNFEGGVLGTIVPESGLSVESSVSSTNKKPNVDVEKDGNVYTLNFKKDE